MKIGIDIDGVLTDIEQWQLDYGSKYFNKNITNYKGYEITEIFNVSNKEDYLFWKKYLYEYTINEKSRKFSNEVMKKLKEEGNEIYIITARYLTNLNNSDGEKMRNTVIDWLKNNDIVYDKLIFSSEDKLSTCLENRIDVMIDDEVDIINSISAKLPVICFNAGYNENCKGINIYRVYSWYDIYLIIHKLKRKW